MFGPELKLLEALLSPKMRACILTLLIGAISSSSLLQDCRISQLWKRVFGATLVFELLF